MKKSTENNQQTILDQTSEFVADKALYLIFIVCFITAIFALTAQENKQLRITEIQSETQSSGSCFGLRNTLEIGVSKNRSTVYMGPLFKTIEREFAGATLGYTYNVLKHEESFSGTSALYLFASAQYHYNQNFSKGWTKIEAQVSKFNQSSAEMNFRDIRFNGFEYALGFRAEKMLTPKLAVFGSVMGVYYQVERQNFKDIKLYYDEKSVVLGLGCGVKYLLGKNF
ncbi:MAG: hypothetical protein ACK4K0_01460 [Flavobacteriales bacterium]